MTLSQQSSVTSLTVSEGTCSRTGSLIAEEDNKPAVCTCEGNSILSSVKLGDVWAAVVKCQALCIFLLAYTMSYAMRLLITQDLLLTKTCLYHLSLDTALCANFSNFSETKNVIEKVANNYSLFILLVQLTPAALLSVFLGPWCDK